MLNRLSWKGLFETLPMLRDRKANDLFGSPPSKAYVFLLLVFLCGGQALGQPNRESNLPGSSLLPKSRIGNLLSFHEAKRFASKTKRLGVSPPLEVNQVINYEMVRQALNLSDRGELLFAKNGFVVVDGLKEDDMIQAYKGMRDRGIPIFVTSDSLLHVFCLQFNQILLAIEQRELLHQLRQLSKAMMEDSLRVYRTTGGVLREAAKRNVSFFAVGLKLQNPEGSVPAMVATDVESEIQNIETRRGFSRSTVFKYRGDFSQFLVRGHYNQNEDLRNYFKAMMWYGRMSFLLKGGLISEKEARIQTLQACLIAASLYRVEIGEQIAAAIWDRIYSVTSFFVGLADDLTPADYMGSMRKLWGDSFAIEELGDEGKLLNLKAELATLRRPKIYGGTGECGLVQPITPEKVDQCLDETQGMHFMGQRFVPDSYIFQNLVNLAYTEKNSPFTLVKSGRASIRGFPRGLDLMALLGSDRAKQILKQAGDTDYEGYDLQFRGLEAEFATFDESQWTRNLYWSWLYSLRRLVETYGCDHPLFMRTDAWQDKQLQTALASWVELRHDTILYAKPSYTLGAVIPPKVEPTLGYVEPVPHFYESLLNLTTLMKSGLSSMDVLDQMERGRLQVLENVLVKLIQVSKDELEGRVLTDHDYDFIRSFGEVLESVVSGISKEGRRSLVIADVHTDLNSGEVLEEAVGYLDLILVSYRLPDGRIVVGAGPVFSYYEFKWPMADRLSDEKWQEMLESGREPGRPLWVEDFIDSVCH